MDINTFTAYYFVGIGGIGMSALARYFHALGKNVAGYDSTQKPVTMELEKLGIDIHYQDAPEHIGRAFRHPEQTLVVYTPAVPNHHQELAWFKANGFTVMKRSRALGLIAQTYKTLAVAGTHGKTSISSMAAHILHESHMHVNAFLGGIANNYQSNLILSDHVKAGVAQDNDWAVVEADEYDRSFLQLYPDIAVISAVEADHLDIYGSYENLQEAFRQFIRQIRAGGNVILHNSLAHFFSNSNELKYYTYSLNDSEADFYAASIRRTSAGYIYDLFGPDGLIAKDVQPQWAFRTGIENAIAAAAAAWLAGAPEQFTGSAIEGFKGIWRRFDVHINRPGLVYIDDYAHHPREIEVTIDSVRDLHPGRHITGVFQPHLYSRTRDFATEFANALNKLDELILLPVYPAREESIKGVTPELIANKVHIPCRIIGKNELLSVISSKQRDVLITMGAGDIDRYVNDIKNLFLGFYENKNK